MSSSKPVVPQAETIDPAFHTGPLMIVSYCILFGLCLVPNFFYVDKSVHMVMAAMLTIYIGAHRSVHPAEKGEAMTASDAYKFPLYGSCVLFGLFVMFSLWKDLIVTLVLIYIVVLGAFAIAHTCDPLIAVVLPASFYGSELCHLKFKDWVDLKVTGGDIVAYFIGGCSCVVYLVTRAWWANNLIGIGFSITSIEMLNLGKYSVGCILLCGLFLYDIFWVFGTRVMVTVAKGFEVPIKLLFPKSLETPLQLSMLGLGDIVIPGIFIALLLRFDVARAKEAGRPLDKSFFHATLLGYFFGLLATIAVMHIFGAAQPALLYLVPGCIGSSCGLAFFRGDFEALKKYSDDDEVEAAEAVEEKEVKKTAKSKKAD